MHQFSSVLLLSHWGSFPFPCTKEELTAYFGVCARFCLTTLIGFLQSQSRQRSEVKPKSDLKRNILTGDTGYVKCSRFNHSSLCLFSNYDRNLWKLDTRCYFRLNDLKHCVKVGHTCTVFMQLKCFNQAILGNGDPDGDVIVSLISVSTGNLIYSKSDKSIGTCRWSNTTYKTTHTAPSALFPIIDIST